MKRQRATAKQKCMNMWKWFKRFPSKTKEDYYQYLKKKGKEKEYDDCWACRLNEIRAGDPTAGIKTCKHCPIDWSPHKHCNDFGTPFNNWLQAHKSKDTRMIKRAIRDMIYLIQTTWKED